MKMEILKAMKYTVVCLNVIGLKKKDDSVLLQRRIRLQTGVVQTVPHLHSIHVCVRAGVLSKQAVSLH